MAVIPPHIPLKQGGGGSSYRQNGWKHKWYVFWVIFDEEFEFQVYFGESAPYGGHPPHIYPSNRVEGVQVTAKMDGPQSRILRQKIPRQHTARIFRNFCGKLYPRPLHPAG